jgi:hypothetical protein
MRKVKMLKTYTYGTRHLEANREYEFSTEHALALVAMRKANLVKPEAKKKETPPIVAAPTSPPIIEPMRDSGRPLPAPIAPRREVAELEQLRENARALGIDVDMRWGRARLNYEIEHKR